MSLREAIEQIEEMLDVLKVTQKESPANHAAIQKDIDALTMAINIMEAGAFDGKGVFC